MVSVLILPVYVYQFPFWRRGKCQDDEFGRSRARMVSTSKVNFTKVAGLEEEKEELEEIVDFLKTQKYTGVAIPKGVSLWTQELAKPCLPKR